MYYVQAVTKILSEKKFKRIFVLSFVLYTLVYLLVTQFLVFGQSSGIWFGAQISPQWQDIILRQRAPFLFESIGVVHLSPYVTFFLSIPNLIFALFLGYLVGLNLAVGYYSFRKLGLSGSKGVVNLVGTIPAILGGAACCVPTLILVLGLQLTATLTTIWPWLVPASIVLLVGSLFWALGQAHMRSALSSQ